MNVLGGEGEQLRKTWGTFWEHPCEYDENNIGNKGELLPKKKPRPLMRRVYLMLSLLIGCMARGTKCGTYQVRRLAFHTTTTTFLGYFLAP
jgi:hypothetical protein